MSTKNRIQADRTRGDLTTRANWVYPSVGSLGTALFVSASILGCVLALIFLYGDRTFANRRLPELQAAPIPPQTAAIPGRPVFATGDTSSASGQVVTALRNESFDVAERLVASLPNNPHAICLLGTVHHRYANEAAAMRLWEECLRIDPGFAEALHLFGLAALRAGNFATAETNLREALRIDPNWVDVPVPLAQSLMNQGKFAEAAEVLAAFVARVPGSTEGWYQLGRVYHHLDDFANARRCHLEALQRDDRSTDAVYGIAIALQKLNETEKAQEYFVVFEQLRQHERTTQRAERVSLTDESLMRNTVVSTRMTAARVCMLYGQTQLAEEHWRRGAALDPRRIECHESLIGLYVQQQRLEDAIRVQTFLCDSQPARALGWHRLGVLNAQLRQPGQAESALLRAIEADPEHAPSYAALAQVQMLPGRDIQDSLRLARKAVELQPTGFHFFVLATVHWNANDTDSARAALERAIQLEPDERGYREAYAKLGQNSSEPQAEHGLLIRQLERD